MKENVELQLDDDRGYFLSWRLAVESNNMSRWSKVPEQFFSYIETYMTGGQYELDVDFIVDQILSYAKGITLSEDGLDAWILDVDDTCISNVVYYKGKRYGVDPFDPPEFKTWAKKGECLAIPAVLKLFSKLVEMGFKVFLVTGRDEETFGQITTENLQKQGFVGYERLVLRRVDQKGKSAVIYKSEVRKEMKEAGYRIWGNVGDQWSDLQGVYVGNRTFKVPNPMYCVP